jgi:predicted ABC-type ATPase
MPSFTLVAGPNGSGKTTLTRYGRESFQQLAVLDPDAIQQGLVATSEGSASAIHAGRAVLRLAEEFLEKGESFVLETTLSGNTHLRMAKHAQAAGYVFVFIFVGTESVEINLDRVRQRVVKGGHDVPEEDQRRRYSRSMANMRIAFGFADRALLFDNSTENGHRRIAMKRGETVTLFEPLPKWAEFLREAKA